MYRARKTRTKSGATAVQAVEYNKGKIIVHKHFGSAHIDKEVRLLFKVASQWIEAKTGQKKFSFEKPSNKILFARYTKAVSSSPLLLRKVYLELWREIGLNRLSHKDKKVIPLLKDLVLMRLIKPSSKLEAITEHNRLFKTGYKKSPVYRRLQKVPILKAQAEPLLVEYAKKNLNFNFKIVFYDVTTLYFETFKNDRLRKPGFSKDNKHSQPQIVLCLVVNETGFPITYHLFPGNTFEGHTIIPVLQKLKKRHSVENLTVVADAAMISRQNVDSLIETGFGYIVGARLANLNLSFIKKISKSLARKDRATTRESTERGELVCSFSQKRYYKDKSDTEKQIEKARYYLDNPSKAVKRLKFLTLKAKKPAINQKLIYKARLLWGVKGYYTNTDLSDKQVVEQYHQLWHVEQSFRISKSDLGIRPTFTRIEATTKAHILICTLALAITRVIEKKTKLSLRKFVKLLSEVEDITVRDEKTETETVIKSYISENVESLIKKFGLTY